MATAKLLHVTGRCHTQLRGLRCCVDMGRRSGTPVSVNPRPPAALAAKAELVARCSSPVLGANCIGVSVMVILLPGLQRERASSAMSKQLERSSSSCHPVVAGGGYKCLWKYYLIITLQSRKYKKCFSFELAKLVISPIIENLMLDFVALPKVIIPLIASDCRLLHKCCLCTQWFFLLIPAIEVLCVIAQVSVN